MKHICLIDGSGYIFRAFYGIRLMTRSDGTPTNAVYGFTNMMIKLLKAVKTDYIAMIFDAKRKNFRNEIYPAYKANRKETPEELVPQFSIIRQACDALNIKRIEMEGYEADDLIATYAKICKEKGMKVTIVSADKDLMQLIEDGVFLYDPMKEKSISIDDVISKFGVTPDKVIDVQALSGDSIDNVPGVPKIGPKTAAQLISEYNNLEELLERASEIKQKTRRENLIKYADDAKISKKLVTLKKDVPVTTKVDEFKLHMPNPESLMSFLDELEFKSIKPRAENLITNWAGDDIELPSTLTKNAKKIEKKYELVTKEEQLDNWIKKIKDNKIFAFDTETTGLDPFKSELVGISIATQLGEACYIPISHKVQSSQLSLFNDDKQESNNPDQIKLEKLLKKLKPLFEDKAILKVGHNIKYDMHVINNVFPEINISPIDDTMVMSYVLDARSHGHSMDELAELFLDYKTIKFSDVCGLGKKQITFDMVDLKDALDYAAEDADITLRLYEILKPRILKEKMTSVYEHIDRPLIPVLKEMEKNGVKVDEKELKSLSANFEKEINRLSQEIYDIAGEEFNIASPKQLGVILFEKMEYEGGKKSKKSGSWTTGAGVLEKLAEEGKELAEKLLLWRQFSKLKSTYSDALSGQINNHTRRVHTSFGQTITSTGRLSSSNPNLQNIPIRSEEGKKIRKTFVSKKGHKLIAADYSQVELRLIAHVANVPALKEAFKNDIDIHAVTASKIFNVPLEEMDSDTRRKAKAVNFGIIYGISAFGLSKQINSSKGEAKEIIDAYFKEFPEIKSYMDNVIQEAGTNGYVKTPFGRKCFTEGINDKSPMRRNFAQRAAINAPIQGGAADIIKFAMIKLYDELKKQKLSAKMLLQVHDELILEVPDEQVEKTLKLVKETMENVVKISVPLTVDANFADSWDKAH